ncbi:hypothetical protein DFR72_1011166 [Lentzea flaviverrucosa]|uniref:Uncharacterized protein n=1 Tax=Lentzea flaviverrucosa TaxID=200379 RepID=A0A1H9ERJ4_9PSEU|nr:hypothetical protein DFR72_1011166 [Lentzea flaviverrucosa]SEQ28235.1 hypothetical protein SAMN05216195_10251 [Lentzea flaviverrucosa]
MEFRPVDIPQAEWDKEPPVRLPPGWDPQKWGWEPVFGTHVPDLNQDLEIFVRAGDDPSHGCSVSTYYAPGQPEAGRGHELFNPVIIHQENGDHSAFRVSSVEELQELLTQVEQHGYADAHAGGWTVHAAPTAAMAQDAVEQDHQRRLVRWDLNSADWVFADAAIPAPVPSVAPRPAHQATVPGDNRASRPGPARGTRDTATPLRDAAKAILAAVRPKRAPDHDIAGPRQGLSHGVPRW